MELYLNWLKRQELAPGEAEPLGIILCAGKRQQHVELLELAGSRIHVASYSTKVLPKRQLEKKLHDAVRLAKARLDLDELRLRRVPGYWRGLENPDNSSDKLSPS